jgi:uncharacterized repeat protein (TIGR01451 family)
MNKLLSKLTSIIKAVPKRTTAIFLALTAILVPMAIFAAGSTRPENLDITKPVDYITFNQYVNNKFWGDEHDFVRVGPTSITSINELKNTVVAQEGKEYYIYVHVHNNAASWFNLMATGVRAQIVSLDKTAGTTQQWRGFIDADNCGAKQDGKGGQTTGSPCSFWDEAGFQSADGRKFTMEYVKGSARYMHVSGAKFTLPDSVATASGNNGTLIGDTSMDGRIPGCDEHIGYVVVRVTPKYEPKQTPSYDVEKKVNNTTHNTAKPGDTMTYTITARNTGNVDLTNVKINDTLPAYYSNASETISAPAGHSGSIINGGSVTLTKLPVGGTATITISYKIKGEAAFQCDKTTNFINKVTSSTDQTTTEDRTDNNQVDTDVTYPCAPKHPSYDLAKTVDKTAAKPGDTLIYTLKYTNTGDVDLTNVVIKDTLPAGINWTNVDINVNNGSGITDKDKLFTTGVKIASVKVGGTVTIKITAKVATDAVPADKCGENRKDFVNRAESTAAEKTGEDNPNNNSATTTVTVNKNCDSSYDVIKTVDKATAKPGETLVYTITVKNTGETDLTNVLVKDTLPGYIASAKATTTAPSSISGDLFKGGVTIAKLRVGEIATIKIEAVIKSVDQLPCGDTNLINRVTSETDQTKVEDDTSNNEATTTVNRDCPKPKNPCPYDPSIDADDPNCVPPTTPTDPTTPTGPPEKPSTPEYIVATGPVEAAAAILGTGALTFGAVAYARSRKDLLGKLLNK